MEFTSDALGDMMSATGKSKNLNDTAGDSSKNPSLNQKMKNMRSHSGQCDIFLEYIIRLSE